jgi:hypothetical protein
LKNNGARYGRSGAQMLRPDCLRVKAACPDKEAELVLKRDSGRDSDLVVTVLHRFECGIHMINYKIN